MARGRWWWSVAVVAVACCVLVGTALPGEAEILLTDVGQGNSAKIIRMLLKKNGISDVTLVELATPEDLEGVSMLIIGVGASTKGLGAAGLDVERETERAASLLAAAREKSLPVVGVHLGGQARRGEISDALNELVMMACDPFIVWQEGNEDGFFTTLARGRLGEGSDDAALAALLRVVESKNAVGTELKDVIEASR